MKTECKAVLKDKFNCIRQQFDNFDYFMGHRIFLVEHVV